MIVPSRSRNTAGLTRHSPPSAASQGCAAAITISPVTPSQAAVIERALAEQAGPAPHVVAHDRVAAERRRRDFVGRSEHRHDRPAHRRRHVHRARVVRRAPARHHENTAISCVRLVSPTRSIGAAPAPPPASADSIARAASRSAAAPTEHGAHALRAAAAPTAPRRVLGRPSFGAAVRGSRAPARRAASSGVQPRSTSSRARLVARRVWHARQRANGVGRGVDAERSDDREVVARVMAVRHRGLAVAAPAPAPPRGRRTPRVSSGPRKSRRTPHRSAMPACRASSAVTNELVSRIARSNAPDRSAAACAPERPHAAALERHDFVDARHRADRTRRTPAGAATASVASAKCRRIAASRRHRHDDVAEPVRQPDDDPCGRRVHECLDQSLSPACGERARVKGVAPAEGRVLRTRSVRSIFRRARRETCPAPRRASAGRASGGASTARGSDSGGRTSRARRCSAA